LAPVEAVEARPVQIGDRLPDQRRDIRHIGDAVALARDERRGRVARLGPQFGRIGGRAGEGIAHCSTASPVHFAAKAYLSAASAMILSVGLPLPWPARVSTRIRCGLSPAFACWSAAVYLKLCPGTTRSSVSAVVTSTAG